MKTYVYLLLFIQCYSLLESAQPYFPSLIAFSLYNNDQIITAIDQRNQEAFVRYHDSQRNVVVYLMKHFPHAIPGTPQSKYYVMLLNDNLRSNCMYQTYYENGTRYPSYYFPSHWFNGTSYYIGNYMKFYHSMIDSTNASLDEDYWYSNETCKTSIEQKIYPCEEIYFKKNTSIPLRHFDVRSIAGYDTRIEIPYTVISIGKSINNYFQAIPKDWQLTCKNADPSLLLNHNMIKLELHESAQVEIRLSASPQSINENNRITVQWDATECIDCFTISPQELIFNTENFSEIQTLTITRVKDSLPITLTAIILGEDCNIIPSSTYSINIH
jgi:hypothetical protein